MPDAHRRIVLKPTGVAGPQLAQLAAALAAAVELQKQLAARSPHILQFTGTIHETERAFLVEHEPARPLATDNLFDPNLPLADGKTLLRLAAAMFDALRAAHEMPGPRPVVHGGICPGVLVVDSDGIDKLTDFGFAPAFCAAMGPERYLHLAVGPRPAASPEEAASAIWEALTPDVVSRDDRICAFIDPEKYATRVFQSFEPKSDIIAAAFVLHLLAEHHHPYFHDDPEAHRMVEVSEYMAMGTATRARRKDLRESAEPGVRLWCELVARMLDRMPQNRPAAAVLGEELGRYERPVSIGDILRRRLETLCQSLAGRGLDANDWDAVAREASQMAESQAAPRDVVEQAGAVARLASALRMLQGDNWHQAAATLAELSNRQDLLGPAADKVRQAAPILERNLAARARLEQLSEALKAAEAAEPFERAASLASLQQQFASASESGDLLPPVQAEVDRARARLADHHKEAAAAAARLEQSAREWLATLRRDAETGDWTAAERRLTGRPAMPPSATDFHDEVAKVEGQLHHRGELIARLQRAEDRLAAGEPAEARPIAEEVERQEAHPDLARKASELRVRIDEEERRLLERKRQIEEARARADERLAAAQKHIDRDTSYSLELANAEITAALAIPEITPAQRQRAGEMNAFVAKRLETMVAEAELGVESLRKAETEIAEARRLLDEGRFGQSETHVKPHVDSPFPFIREEAGRIAGGIAEGIARRREELKEQLAEAAALIEKDRLDDAHKAATQVLGDEYAGDELRREAQHCLDTIRNARLEADEAQRRAASDRDLAVAALGNARIEEAQRHARSVLDNRRAEKSVREDAERLANELSALEEADALSTRGEFEPAVAVLETILRRPPDDNAVAQAAARAATAIKERAVQRKKAHLINSMETHLLHLAEQEKQSPSIDSGWPGVRLPAATPQWLRTTITSFDTFVQDCVGAAQPGKPSEAMAAGTRIGDKYEVLEFLGRGGMGEVYRARDLALDREVALKLAPVAAEGALHADALRNEAKAIAALNHPHIIHINSFDVIDGRPCFDTNYIRGQDLAQYAREHKLSWREIADVLIPIADALAYAHGQGVLHRDIKPQNIYLGEHAGAGPWLIDFGLARMRSICDRRANTGLCGTPGYIAPEVITSMGEEVDHRSDVFALGCVLYNLMTGQPPFQIAGTTRPGQSLSVSQALLNTLRSLVAPLSEAAADAPPALRGICERAMAHEPNDRYPQAADMARDLRRFVLELDGQEVAGALAEARESFARRPRNQFAEIAALEEARGRAEHASHLAEEARRRAEQTTLSADDPLASVAGTLQNQCRELLGEIRGAATAIADSQVLAQQSFKEATEATATGRYRVALASARAVLANPTVPDLHAESEKLAAEAERQRSLVMRKRVKIGAAVAGAAGVVSLVAFVATWLIAAPRFTREPGDQNVQAGTVATFAVSFKPSDKASYQWQVKRTTAADFTDVQGASTPTFTTPPTTPEDDGSRYRCAVTVASGSTVKHLVSSAGTLKVAPAAVVPTPPTPDTTPPTVAITQPTAEPAYASSTGTLAVSGTSSDDAGVTELTWSNDRGGEGAVPPSPAWRIDAIPLKAGKNVLTVTARDAAGNRTSAVLTANYTPQDTTPPALAITHPTNGAEHVTSASAITIAGAASDDVAVADVTWSNDQGGQGTSSPSPAWRIEAIPLKAGKNVLTVTARDAAGNKTTAVLTVTYALPDTTPPALTITQPAGEGEHAATTNTVTIAGTASDDVGVTEVTWSNDRGGQGACSPAPNWKADAVPLQAGTNLITVTARDAAGNKTSAVRTMVLASPDKTTPTVSIAQPTKEAALATPQEVLAMAGSASDNVGVTEVNWSNDRGGNGRCEGEPGSWRAAGIKLSEGKNTIAVSARDAVGNVGTATLVVTYSPPPKGWPVFDAAAQQTIKDLLLNGPAKSAMLAGCDPAWLAIASTPGKLSATVTFPWSRYEWAAGGKELRVDETPFPAGPWPAAPGEQATAAATAIASALDKKVAADRLLLAVLAQASAWKDRTTLERELLAAFPGGIGQPTSIPAERLTGPTGYLTRTSRIKWMTDTAPETPALSAWTPRLQSVLETNRGRTQITVRVPPTRFVEYFWGPEFVHAVYWFGDQPNSPAARYVRLGPSAEIGRQVRDAMGKAEWNGGLGEQLLGAIVRDAGGGTPETKFLPSGTLRHFGIAISPDGPLCLAPLLRLPFQPVSLSLTLPDVDLGTSRQFAVNVSRLDALGTGDLRTTPTATWLLLSLGAAPPTETRLASTELWELARQMLGRPAFAPAQAVNTVGKVFNGQIICEASQLDAIQKAMQGDIKTVNESFRRLGGNEVFDVGFLVPRTTGGASPWFMVLADPITAAP